MYRLKIEDLCKNRILSTILLGNNTYYMVNSANGQDELNPELAGPSRQDSYHAHSRLLLYLARKW